jgi:GT2 family glycosyltransferase
MIDSVRAQTYGNWELCIADGNSSSQQTKKILTDYARSDNRIRLAFLDKNLGIAGNSNAALHLASGDFITLLDHDDTLAPFALHEVVTRLQQPETKIDILYSDEDFINANGKKRFSPTFKPSFGWDTLRSHNYICHLLVFRNEIINKTGGFRKGFDGSQDYDLVLRACELAREIVHIPKILYHWRVHPASTAGNPNAKNYAHDAGRKALQEHLDRCNLSGQASNGLATGLYQAIYHPTEWPLISIIIPSKDQASTLRTCLDSILAENYPNLEILILENGSTDTETFQLYEKLKHDPRFNIINWTKPFSYAAINNYGAKLATGELLLFLNNDIESLKKENLFRLAEHAIRPETGAVGAALFYPDNTIQHAGVVLGMTGIAGHTLRHTPKGKLGYGFRMATIRNLSCVTGACLMIKRKTFDEVNGFDENLAIAFNDIDLCLKVRESGYSVVWTPHAEYTHFESKTRGPEDTPEKISRFHREINYFKSKWNKQLMAGDEFYSPNLNPESETPSIRTTKN